MTKQLILVEVIETIRWRVPVEADSEDEAMNLAGQVMANGESHSEWLVDSSVDIVGTEVDE